MNFSQKIEVVFTAVSLVFFGNLGVSKDEIVTGPWLQAGTETSLVVMWESAEAKPGIVEFGLTRKLGNTIDSKVTTYEAADTDGKLEDDAAIIHESKLTGLNPGEVYFYRVRSGEAESEMFTFRTHRKTGPFRILSISNTHGFKLRAEREKFEIVSKIPVDFVLNQADQTQQSLNREYRKQIQGSAVSSTNTVWYTARGNHENREWSRYSAWYHNEFRNHLDESFYSFDVGNIHFVVLNEVGKESLFPKKWFRKDITASGKKWNVVVAKKPPHLFGKTFLYDLFRESGIDIMLAADCGTRKGAWPQPYQGDNAWYKDVWYLTSCGGYQVIEASENTWKVETFSAKGLSKEITRIEK